MPQAWGIIERMKLSSRRVSARIILAAAAGAFFLAPQAHAALTLTAGDNATTTPNVATAITGFQIVGPAASTTPVKLHATNGTIHLSAVDGVTMSGNNSGTVSLSGTVGNLNEALATLTYTRSSTGTDTLEISLVDAGEVFFPENEHLYEYIPVTGSIAWPDARDAAAQLERYGATGYLATVLSGDENAFIAARLQGEGWMGASDQGEEGAWKWVTGPEAGMQFWSGDGSGHLFDQVNGYANWNSGEPNNSSDEDCAQFLVSGGSSGKWNDLRCTSERVLPGYVAEFGAPGDMPVVVAQDISIVTADVPAVASLTPANGASDVATTTGLTIAFTKAVTPQAGDIEIREADGGALTEAIDVAGENVGGGGTSTITLQPSAPLAEGVRYYVTVPGTAFKDSAGNLYEGFTNDTTWTFTTADEHAPQITDLATTIASTSALVSWTTNEDASSKVLYSAGTTYDSSTAETDTSPRVTSHAVPLSGLSSCTTYNVKAVSEDAAGNEAASASASFTTLGCIGSPPTSATSTTVTAASAATTTLTDTGHSLTVSTPPDVTATSSTVVIQIRAQEAAPVLGTTGVPDGLTSAAGVVFDVKAIVNATEELDSFDHPVTITYTYTDADIAGLDEHTIWLYHYHDGAWERLSDCSLDMTANTITCDTPNFSIFSIFGSAPEDRSGGSHSSGGSGTTIQAQVRNLTEMGKIAEAQVLKSRWYWLFPETAAAADIPSASSAVSAPAAVTGMAVRDLELGTTGEDVRALQQLLNANGFPLAASGVGSPGNETDYFGTLTQAAVAAYQAANNVAPTAGYFGTLTRASMTAKGIAGLWW